MRGKDLPPLEWNSRPPYMAGGLGFSIRDRWTLIGVGYRLRKVAFHIYREDPAILGPTWGAATVI
jgi:hypothetical protein